MAGISTKDGSIIPSPKSTGADTSKGSVGNAGVGANNSSSNVSKPTPNAVKSKNEKAVKDRVNSFIEGVAQVVPNCDYKCKKIYGFRGLGKIFTGNYYVQKVTHVISDNYSVNLEVTQVEKVDIEAKKEETRKEPVKPAPPKAPEAPKNEVITIKKGDTLWALSRKYGTTVEALAKLNGIKNPDLIYAGAPLKVPSK